MYRRKPTTEGPVDDDPRSTRAVKRQQPDLRTVDGQDAIALIRAPLLNLLSVNPEENIPVLFRPFSNPLLVDESYPTVLNTGKKRTLGVRFPKTSFGTLYRSVKFVTPPSSTPEQGRDLPPPRPLTLWEPEEGYVDRGYAVEKKRIVEVDDMLTSWLRDHQRQGVDFMYQCLTGQKAFDGYGVILADDMGLGKTLQSIAVTWTLMNTPHPPMPANKTIDPEFQIPETVLKRNKAVRRALIVCPSSLVKNWAAEFDKWLSGRCKVTAVAETQKEKVVSAFEGFEYDRESLVLVSSYETFRLHAHRLKRVPIDLLICDEAHRLKNDRTKIAITINGLNTSKRILISGTPIQNDLDEFYALVSIANARVLGEPAAYRRNFVRPILTGREPGATPQERAAADEALERLSSVTNEFIIRRSNALLAKVLPVKLILNVFCDLTPIQKQIYTDIVRSKAIKKLAAETEADNVPAGGAALSAIQTLMKLCSHPILLCSVKAMNSTFKEAKETLDRALASVHGDISGSEENQPPPSRSSRRLTSMASTSPSMPKTIIPSLSGKFHFLAELLREIKSTTNDKVVIISNYTQTLDLIGEFCKRQNHHAVRLDGSMAVAKRHQLVCQFNDIANERRFVFLLSSKAGGCGINLIGANRLVMFDPDWNPANDKQALARIWRDGQKKQCYIYRLFSVGSIEEKIFQRQIGKDGLGAMVVTNDFAEAEVVETLGGKAAAGALFDIPRIDTLCDTHDLLDCRRCDIKNAKGCDQLDPTTFNEDSLATWAHHCAPFHTIEDETFTGVDYSQVPVRFCMTARIEVHETPDTPAPVIAPAPPATPTCASAKTPDASKPAPSAVQTPSNASIHSYEYYTGTNDAAECQIPNGHTPGNTADDVDKDGMIGAPEGTEAPPGEEDEEYYYYSGDENE